MSNVDNLKDGVCRFPIAGFSAIQEREGLAIVGRNASGKTVLMFDIGACLLVAGKRIGIIADELDGITVIEKITISLREQLIAEGVADENAFMESIKHHVVIFDSFQVFENSFRSGNIPDLDAILCDTFGFGSYKNDSRLDFITGQLEVLDEAREKNGIIYTYTFQGDRPAPDASIEVVPVPMSFTRILYTSKILGKLRVEELDREGKTVATTEWTGFTGDGMSWASTRNILDS